VDGDPAAVIARSLTSNLLSGGHGLLGGAAAFCRVFAACLFTATFTRAFLTAFLATTFVVVAFVGAAFFLTDLFALDFFATAGVAFTVAAFFAAQLLEGGNNGRFTSGTVSGFALWGLGRDG
jgi:predicted membrane channel-forming protein YqfA (hemolysin III family)